MKTTPVYGLRYPFLGDNDPFGPSTIQQLAEDAEDAITAMGLGGFYDLGLFNSFVAVVPGAPRLVYNHQLVTLVAEIRRATSVSTPVIACTIPAGLEPAMDIRVPMHYAGTGSGGYTPAVATVKAGTGNVEIEDMAARSAPPGFHLNVTWLRQP